MSRLTKIILTTIIIAAVGTGAWAMLGNQNQDDENAIPTITVERGDIVDKALAVGTIEPRVEISVKSQFSGVVKRQYADVGDFVQAGTKLLDVQPNPTPQELIEAERRIELRELELKNLGSEFERQTQMFEKKLISAQEFERAKRSFDEATLQVQISKEQLALLREGRITNDKGDFESTVRAPVSGFILDKMVEIGDPVVPLTSYQEGTVLMTMANMDDLIFRGTVDEIDVGRLTAGMNVEIKVGALPEASVFGVLSKIWLKATKEENSTVFPIEIEIQEATRPDVRNPESTPLPVVLRAGYSANAEIIIEKREQVLLIPERVITFKGDTALVQLVSERGSVEDINIDTGLSDAILIEVVAGLEEGALLQEKPPKQIE
jgi:HlyD family secretion protein